MSWDPTPWFIGGGASHSPEIVRTMLYSGTAGAEGIVSPADLRVTQTTTASGTLNVGPGSALMLNRSSGATQQTYAARNPTADTVSVAPNDTASTRFDYVIARVEDPQYAPWPAPADPLTAQYVRSFVVQGQANGLVRIEQLNLAYPAVLLARVAIPANTSAITNAMITDLRRVALPRSDREVNIGLPTTAVSVTTTAFTNMFSFPSTIEIPTWATTAVVVLQASGLLISTASFVGSLRASFLGAVSQTTTVDENFNTNPHRTSYMVASRFPVPVADRGLARGLILQGARSGGTGALSVNGGSTLVLDITFQERAD